MTQPFRDAQAFIAALADMAEALRHAILAIGDDAERSDYLMKLLAESDMVFGLWPDPDDANGVGIQIIKGDDILPPLVGFGTQHELHIAAIPCACREVAVAAREAWGISDAQDNGSEPCTARAKLAASESERSKWASRPRSNQPPRARPRSQ